MYACIYACNCTIFVRGRVNVTFFACVCVCACIQVYVCVMVCNGGRHVISVPGRPESSPSELVQADGAGGGGLSGEQVRHTAMGTHPHH